MSYVVGILINMLHLLDIAIQLKEAQGVFIQLGHKIILTHYKPSTHSTQWQG